MKQLKFLMESELLTDEVKTQLTEAVVEMKTEFEAKVSADYATKLISEQETLEDSLTKLINESITVEVSELKEDIAKYRKLEIEYAEKLETFKEEYQEKLNEAVETFVDETITEEVAELKVDLAESRKDDFGKRLFEAFSDEFAENGYGGDLKEVAAELKTVKASLKESVAKVDTMLNESTKSELLANLSGKKQKIMSTLLEGVSTDELETKYNASIEFVLDDSGKETLNESDHKDGERIDFKKEEKSILSESDKDRIRTLIGKK